MLLFVVAGTAHGAPENRYGVAVIIGNRAYSDNIPAVEFAHNDAKAMRDYVTTVLGYRPGNVIDLRDASLADLRKVFGDGNSHKGPLFNYIRAGKSDVFVFYSGHGVPGLRDRRGYLLPKDGDPNLAEFTGYPLDILYANLRKIPAKSVTVVIDACFSGNTPKGMLVAATSGLTVTVRPNNTKGITLLTAARGDQVASWDEKAKLGLFTKHFLAGVMGVADSEDFGNGDGKVTLAELRGYLNEEMSYQARRRYGREQTPTVQGRDDLILAVLPPSTASAISIEPIEGTYVAVRNANVRAAPDVDALKVAMLPKGSTVHVAGKVASKDWLAVDRDGKRLGYVYSKLLQDLKEARAEAIARAKARRNKADAAAKAKQYQEAWDSIKDSRIRSDFKAYMAQYPKGLHYFAALVKIKILEREKIAAIVPPKITAPKPAKPMVGVYPDRKPGDSFKDCDDCPEMVLISRGRFRMGDLNGSGNEDEKPVHEVRIAYRFAVGKYEVTFAQWEACATDGGCGGYRPDDEERGRNQFPVMNVNWNDAKRYTAWLSWKTGRKYRLLTESEWEYVTRAGTTTKYFWGDVFVKGRVNVDPRVGNRAGGSQKPNDFGLYDLIGNVWEWVEDCGHDNYRGAPGDGSAWIKGGDCSFRSVRGGSSGNFPRHYRSAFREREKSKTRQFWIGFRVAKTLSR